jgi:hypothetical protein
VPAVYAPLVGADDGARFSSCGRSPSSPGERVPIRDETAQFPPDGRYLLSTPLGIFECQVYQNDSCFSMECYETVSQKKKAREKSLAL